MQNVLKSYMCFNFWLVQNVSIEKHVHCVHDGQRFTCFNWMLPSAINMLTKNTHPQKQHNFRIISWQLFLCMQWVWSVIWLYTVNYLLYFTQERYFVIPLFCIKIDFSYYVIMPKTAWKLLVLNREILKSARTASGGFSGL